MHVVVVITDHQREIVAIWPDMLHLEYRASALLLTTHQDTN